MNGMSKKEREQSVDVLRLAKENTRENEKKTENEQVHKLVLLIAHKDQERRIDSHHTRSSTSSLGLSTHTLKGHHVLFTNAMNAGRWRCASILRANASWLLGGGCDGGSLVCVCVCICACSIQ